MRLTGGGVLGWCVPLKLSEIGGIQLVAALTMFYEMGMAIRWRLLSGASGLRRVFGKCEYECG